MTDLHPEALAAAAAGVVLLDPGRPYGVIAFHGGRTHAVGTYDDAAQIAYDTARLAPYGGEVYVTLSPVTAEFAGRHPLNEGRVPRRGDSPGDADITRRTRLLIDIEPERTGKLGSTDAQLTAASRLADHVEEHLTALGWPLLARVCSGNGFHLYYRIDLPGGDGGLVKRVLAALASRFDGDYGEPAKIDTSVHNAARLRRVPGAWNRKGDGGPDSPHRMCRVEKIDPAAGVVTEEQMRAVAAEVPELPPPPKPAPRKFTGGSFDLDRFMADCLPDAEGPHEYGGDRKWILPVCPWDPVHTNRSAFVIERTEGTIQAGCHHDGCDGKKWPDLRALFDRGYAARKSLETRLNNQPPRVARAARKARRRRR